MKRRLYMYKDNESSPEGRRRSWLLLLRIDKIICNHNQSTEVRLIRYHSIGVKDAFILQRVSTLATHMSTWIKRMLYC